MGVTLIRLSFVFQGQLKALPFHPPISLNCILLPPSSRNWIKFRLVPMPSERETNFLVINRNSLGKRQSIFETFWWLCWRNLSAASKSKWLSRSGGGWLVGWPAGDLNSVMDIFSYFYYPRVRRVSQTRAGRWWWCSSKKTFNGQVMTRNWISTGRWFYLAERWGYKDFQWSVTGLVHGHHLLKG